MQQMHVPEQSLRLNHRVAKEFVSAVLNYENQLVSQLPESGVYIKGASHRG
jgi:Tfp pilus assembly protein PilF